MSTIPEMSGGRHVFPMPQGVTSVAAADFSSNVCTLKMNPTSTAGEVQLTGAVVTVTPGATGDDLVLPPVGQSKGLVLYIVNLHADHHIDLMYTNSSGTDVVLSRGASALEDEELATCVCDGTYWYAGNALST